MGGERAAACRIMRNVWNDLNFYFFGSAWGCGGRFQNHKKYMLMFILLLVHVLHLPPGRKRKSKIGRDPAANIKEATQEQQKIHQQQRIDKRQKKTCALPATFKLPQASCKYKQCEYKQWARKTPRDVPLCSNVGGGARRARWPRPPVMRKKTAKSKSNAASKRVSAERQHHETWGCW